MTVWVAYGSVDMQNSHGSFALRTPAQSCTTKCCRCFLPYWLSALAVDGQYVHLLLQPQTTLWQCRGLAQLLHVAQHDVVSDVWIAHAKWQAPTKLYPKTHSVTLSRQDAKVLWLAELARAHTCAFKHTSHSAVRTTHCISHRHLWPAYVGVNSAKATKI